MKASDLLAGLARRGAAGLMRSRGRLPGFVNRLIDDVAKNPDGVASRISSRLLGGTNPRLTPSATTIPDAPIRVYIGPTNYAGQGHLWAQALEASPGGIAASNMAVELPGGFGFPADTTVPVAVYNASSPWQRAEFEAVKRFTHVLVEAERPLFGSLFDRDVAREIDALEAAGVSCAFMCHGTDIRSPRANRQRNPWSPYPEGARETARLQADADFNLALLRSRSLPIFVSTPDLLLDVPEAHWCPVVVDPDRWVGGRTLLASRVPVVAHIPSMSSTKGTRLVEPALRALHQTGVIDYRTITGVASERMPQLIGEADIVLDQFRIGSYGVAGCEAMAAGRVVVGHVAPQVRRTVRALTGLDLPIVEADPDTLEAVLTDLVASPDRMRAAAAAGGRFVRKVHSGARSATVLKERWIGGG